MRICKVIFSTNRVNYLLRTLESFHKNLDFGDHEVHGIFFDDYPTGRNDGFIEAMARRYGYNQVILHKENIGLTSTWREFFDLIKDQNFDYIWHQEDDVELLVPLKVDTMINLFQSDPKLCQILLKRQPWYFTEQLVTIEDNDILFEDYRYTKSNTYFNCMACFYPHWVSTIPYNERQGANPSEAVIMHTLNSMHNWDIFVATLKQKDGTPMVDHIGEVTKGKRVVPTDPGYDAFGWMDPTKRYSSRNGAEIDPNASDE